LARDVGSANSKLEVLEELRENFDRSKATRPSLPRPGTKVPIEFAATERVGLRPELAKDFVKRVLAIDWAWVSDESSLGDFHQDETNEVLPRKFALSMMEMFRTYPAGTSPTFSTGFRSIEPLRQLSI
jgi:hypothetical protein